MQDEPDTLADDILRGASSIAEFLLGDPHERAKVYHLRKTAGLPLFNMGGIVCGRKSRLRQWVTEQEAAARGKRA